MACDPNFSDVGLLLPMTGANGSTTFVDASSNAFTVTNPGGHATISTAEFPSFETSSGKFQQANGGALTVPLVVSGPLDISAGDFTIEFWMFPDATLGSVEGLVFGTSDGVIAVQYNYGSQELAPTFFGGSAPGGSGGSIPDVTWTAIAYVCVSNVLTLYIGGVATGTPVNIASARVSHPITAGTFNISQTTFPDFGGYLSNFRLTKGVGRYTSNYTPTGPFGGTCAVTVPNVVGEVLATAESNITAALLTVGAVTTANDPVIPAGSVVSQSPVGGSAAMQTDPVDLVNSLGPVMFNVPDVVGDDDATAQAAILAASFTIGAITFAGDASPAGTVLSQNPAAGTSAVGATPVDLVESLGFTVGNVPNVVGLPLADAEATLTAAALTTGTLTFNFSATVPAGDVISQFPLAGTAVSVGSAVALQISKGITPITVPDLTGLTAAEADAALQAAGLLTGGVSSAYYALIPIGEVFRQNPAPFTVVAADTLVSYVISLGIFVPSSTFDFEQTVISQYANSPTLLQLVANMGQYVDMRTNFVEFFNFVWNVNTAQGFGLDIWGAIVGVSRLLQIPGSVEFFGFENPDTPVNVLPFNFGVFNSKGAYATDSFLLPDDAYRTLILVKALSNISATTAPSINQLLRNLFPGRGNAYVLDLGGMAMEFHFAFSLSVTELAIMGQSGALPHPAGVSVTITSI